MGGWQVLLAVLAVPCVGFMLHWQFGDPAAVASEIVMWLIYGLAATGIVFLAIFVWNLIWAPYRIERDRRRALEMEVVELLQRLTPKVSCSLASRGALINRGGTLTSWGGKPQTMFNMAHHAVMITCTNLTQETIHGVRAYLIGAVRIRADGTEDILPIHDEIELSWNETGTIDERGVTLLPGRSQSIYFLVILPNAITMLYLNTEYLNRIPARYHQMFTGSDRFRFKIGAYTDGGAPCFYELEVQNNNPANDRVDLSQVKVIEVELLMAEKRG